MKPEHVAVRMPRATHMRLVAMQKTLEGRLLASSKLRADVSLGSVIESALDALEAAQKESGEKV